MQIENEVDGYNYQAKRVCFRKQLKARMLYAPKSLTIGEAGIMEENKYQFTDEELENELGSWTITSLSNNFAQSYKTLYKTPFTTIAAKSFHVPKHDSGEIHHFDLSIRIFKRRKKAETWAEVRGGSENSSGLHCQLDINAGSGKAVQELTNYILAQYKLIGTKIDSDKVVIEKPADIDVSELLKDMSIDQIEKFGHSIRIQTLVEYKDFLFNNLDKNEKFIQDWLDEDKGKFRKQRCLIFGLEFIDHKREGELSRKRFDILTRTSTQKNEYVIFELKSPCDDVFKIEEKVTPNEGKTTEYHLSPQISRAIPQILHYKSLLEAKVAGDDDLQRLGIGPGKVAKCIILIGKRYDDPIWEEHFKSIRDNFSNVLEIWTYSDLIEKLDVTIKNLEENL